jgi:hypothetical protein
MIEHRMSTRLRLALIRETPEYIDRNTRLFPSQFRQGHEAVRSLLSQPLTILVLAWGLCSLAGYAMLLRTAQTPATRILGLRPTGSGWSPNPWKQRIPNLVASEDETDTWDNPLGL